jgi:hypothetical protein
MLTTSITRAIARTSMMIASIAVAATVTIAAARVGIAAAEPAAAPTTSPVRGAEQQVARGSHREAQTSSSMRPRPTVVSRSCT